jgi:hypothetical protein
MDLDGKMKTVALAALFLIVSHLPDFIEKFQSNLIIFLVGIHAFYPHALQLITHGIAYK